MKPLRRPLELPRRVLHWAFTAAFVPQPVTYVCTGCGVEHMPRDGRVVDGAPHRCCRNSGTWKRTQRINE